MSDNPTKPSTVHWSWYNHRSTITTYEPSHHHSTSPSAHNKATKRILLTIFIKLFPNQTNQTKPNHVSLPNQNTERNAKQEKRGRNRRLTLRLRTALPYPASIHNISACALPGAGQYLPVVWQRPKGSAVSPNPHSLRR